MICWSGVFEALNPTLVCRRYEVVAYGYGSGSSEWFWSLTKAKQRYFELLGLSKQCETMHITLTDAFIWDEPAPRLEDDTTFRTYVPIQRLIWTSGQLRVPCVDEDGGLIGWDWSLQSANAGKSQPTNEPQEEREPMS